MAGFLLELALDPVGKASKVVKGGVEGVDSVASALTRRGVMQSTRVGSTGIRSAIGGALGADTFSLHGLAGAAAQKTVTSFMQGLRVSDGTVTKAGDIARRLGADAATGNWVVGPAVLGVRESSLALKTALYNAAQDGTNTFAKKAADLLEWGYGPLASATDPMRRLMTKVIGMQEELPRTIVNIKT